MKSTIDLELLSQLIQQARQGNRQAQSGIYDLISGSIFRFCYFLTHNESEAHDLCHDTFVKGLTSLHQIKNDKAALGWFLQIARHQFLDSKKKKKEELFGLDQPEASYVSNSDDWLTLKKAMAQLSSEDQTLILLIELEGLSYAEAAQSLGSSEDAIRMKLHKLGQFLSKQQSSSETKD